MGYVDAFGMYNEGEPKMAELVTERSVNWKQGDHDRQRQDHKADLIRPYLANGDPNPEFIQQYPEESKHVYHFIPDDDEIAKER